MTNPKLEEIARRQMRDKTPIPKQERKEAYETICYDSNKAPIIVLKKDYYALEAMLKQAGKEMNYYFSENEGIVEGRRVVRLYLSNSRITKVPDEIGNLDQLTDLYLGGNLLKSFPGSLLKLTNLRLLDLQFNLISEWPKEITKLTKLETLNIKGNASIKIPEFLAEMPSLTTIGASAGSRIPLSLQKKEVKFI